MDPWILLLEDTSGSRPAARRLARELSSPARALSIGPACRPTSPLRLQFDRPADRGTGPDALVGLVHVLARDLDADVVIVPGNMVSAPAFDVALAVQACLDEPDGDVPHLVASEVAPAPGEPWIFPMECGPGQWPVPHSVGRAVPPRGAFAITGVVVGSAWRLASEIRAARPEWFHALRTVVWSPEVAEGAYECLDGFDLLEDILLRDLDLARVVPALPWRDAPTRRLPMPQVVVERLAVFP